jgi:molybdopterin converting factor small subunit
MNITVKYFGMISEMASTSDEIAKFENPISVKELREHLQQKYPSLLNITFSIAMNHSIVGDEVMINNDSEIALLPPFAGG